MITARWNQVRGFLPIARVPLYAGIPGPYDVRVGEDALRKTMSKAKVTDHPEYEKALVSGLKSHVRPGDRVVVVGGGIGITAAVAALKAGPNGSIICFEGDRNAIQLIEKTFLRNQVDGHARVVEAIVGDAIHVYSANQAQKIVLPEELPTCDVLELDCEGSEIGILSRMTISPRVILVETHGFRGAPSGSVRELLVQRGYNVENYGVAEPLLRQACLEQDIMVLAAHKKI